MPLFLGMGALGAGTSLLGGLFGSSAAETAAQEQSAAEQKGINFLQGEQTTGLNNYQPYLSAGGTATATLGNLAGTPGQGLLTPWTQQFTAPTAAQAEATPGYQFQLQQGLSATQNSAAGQGGLLSGRTLADLNNYAQGTASTNYQNTFNNSLTQYQSAYNTFQNNQNNEYSRLMGLSGQGLTAAQGAGQLLSSLGGDTASLYGAQGAAQAAGTVGAANAWSGALSGTSNAMMGGLMLGSLSGNGSWMGGSNPLGLGVPNTGPSTFNPAPVPGYAFGTDYAPGGPAMVGEQGPEMVNLPQGSQVIPNPGTMPPPTGAPMPYRPIAQPNPSQPADPFGGAPMPYRPISGAAPGNPFGNFPMWGAQPRGFSLSALA